MDGHLDMEYQYMVHGGGEHQVLDTDMELSTRSPKAGHGRKQRLLGTWRDLNFKRLDQDSNPGQSQYVQDALPLSYPVSK